MLLDVKPILRDLAKRLTFHFEMDLSDLEFSGRHPVSRPVVVEGQAYSSADVLLLDLTARSTLDAVCDRCGKEFLQNKEVPYSGGAPGRGQRRDRPAGGGKGGFGRSGPDRVYPRNGHQDIVFGRLQGTVPPVRR